MQSHFPRTSACLPLRKKTPSADIMAFVAGPLLPSSPPRRRARTSVRASVDPWDGHDTFSGFEALCWRAQLSLCAETAAADGLGTFEDPPSYLPSPLQPPPPPPRGPARRARAMRGGRAFSSAVVSVWRASPPASGRARLLTHLSPTGVRHAAEAVGVSLRLAPRNPSSPLLRADAHYFQLGGGATSWWFSGAADLVPGPRTSPNAFGRDARAFLARCRKPCDEHRASDAPGSQLASARFLEACLATHHLPPAGAHDQAAAFAFMVDVLDAFLPSYLPLVRAVAGKSVPDITPTTAADPRPEFTERFGLRGGASCESEVAQAGPLGSWRFTLAPRENSPEGRRFWSLRNSDASGYTPPAYF